METVNLCMCNNCGSVLIDTNPQVNAQMIEVNAKEYDTLITGIDKKDGETAKICPNCETDSYLIDL